MKAINLTGPNIWKVEDLPMPSVKKGQVLIKMAFSPINPSDLSFLTGNYGLKKPFPVVPGLEGSGEVIESGGGFLANRLVGKKVACTAPAWGNGTWAEYMVTDANLCIDVSEKSDLQQVSMMFVNPLTALSFAKQTKKSGADMVLLSAAGSALAKMVLFFLQSRNIDVVGVVRRSGQIEDLENKGFKKVFATDNADYLQQLKAYSKNYKKAIFFDAIGGGDEPYKLLNVLPAKSKLVIYGRLELKPAAFEPQQILFKENKVEGYWLSKESARKSFLEIMNDIRQVKKMLASGFATPIHNIYGIEAIDTAIADYTKNMSSGKVLMKLN